MSRTFSSSGPRRGGTFRPQVEALEDRFAPGSLFGTSPGPLIEPGARSAVARERPEANLAFLAGLPASHHRLPTVTIRPVTEFSDPSVVRGSSVLIRTDRSITILLTATDVPAGAYTAWVPIFNPGETTPVAAGWVAGRVVGEGGNLIFAVHLKEGEFLSGHPVFPSGSLQDARLQEVRVVVRYHGPVDPGRLYEQTHTFEPGVARDFLVTIHRPQ